jgi:hypothetical protein
MTDKEIFRELDSILDGAWDHVDKERVALLAHDIGLMRGLVDVAMAREAADD